MVYCNIHETTIFSKTEKRLFFHFETDIYKMNEKIIKQIDFYFSDSNLPRDKFLKGLVDSNPEGYIF